METYFPVYFDSVFILEPKQMCLGWLFISVDIWPNLCWVSFLVLYFGCPFGSLEPMVAMGQLIGSVSRVLPGVDLCSYR